MDVKTYWNEIGSRKEFADPLYIERLRPYLSPETRVVEYGCGYGRMLNHFHEAGCRDLIGFDIAPAMLERGSQVNPHLDLRLVEVNGKIDLPDDSADICVVATVLCSMVEKEDQLALMAELRRILRPRGVLYLTDFLRCEAMESKYEPGGLYTTSEGLRVRHHTTDWIMEVLRGFDIQWFEQFDFKTMNGNPARSFHTVAVSKIS